MILADKIIRLRKRNGWSQEELAEKMNVSRQAVSKWESAQTIPDLEKILLLSSLFGVTTDYLLKDEMEDEEFTDETDFSVKRITLSQADDFLQWRKSASIQIAAATFLCVIAVIPLLLLGTASTVPAFSLSGNVAGSIGLVSMFVFVAIAATMFLRCGFKNAPYEFIDKEPFEIEYGVASMVKERQKEYRSAYARSNIIATGICILSPVPLLVGAFTENEFLVVIMLAITLLFAGIGAGMFIAAGGRWASMQKLLKEGEYAPQEIRKSRTQETVATAYWLSATAIYLAWSFLTDAWETTWIVWPVAGVLFAGVMAICRLLIDKKNGSDLYPPSKQSGMAEAMIFFVLREGAFNGFFRCV